LLSFLTWLKFKYFLHISAVPMDSSGNLAKNVKKQNAPETMIVMQTKCAFKETVKILACNLRPVESTHNVELLIEKPSALVQMVS